MTLALVLATAVVASLLTWYFAGRRHVADTLRYGALAPAWREGYLQGVDDERISADANMPGYGPNRGNPYLGAETLARHA